MVLGLPSMAACIDICTADYLCIGLAYLSANQAALAGLSGSFCQRGTYLYGGVVDNPLRASIAILSNYTTPQCPPEGCADPTDPARRSLSALSRLRLLKA
jgi:hypothetical protein